MGTLGAAGTGEDAGLASAGGTEETQLRVLACCCAARCKRCVLCLPSLSLQYELWNMKNRNLKMGLGVASCVGLGVGIPVFALNLQFWKAKGGK